MPSLKEYTKKLSSLHNTLKMTGTMKMVSVSKLRRAQETQRQAKYYADHLNELIGRLSASVPQEAHPLLRHHGDSKRALILLFTSDKGLCGGFNNNMIRSAVRWAAEHKAEYPAVDFSFCGRRGYASLRQRVQVTQHYEGITGAPHFLQASRIGKDVMGAFLEGRYSDIYLAYNVFTNPLKQTPRIAKLLPLEPGEFAQHADGHGPYLFEPPIETLLDMLIPRAVDFKIFFALLENSAGEHGARMTAMESATANAEKLIDTYTLLRNRARQAAITTELIEIISGAEAL